MELNKFRYMTNMETILTVMCNNTVHHLKSKREYECL